MLNILKSDRPYILIVFPFIVIACWLDAFLTKDIFIQHFDTAPMPLYSLVMSILPLAGSGSLFLSVMLILVSSFLLMRINANYRLIEQGTYLPAILFVILSASFPSLTRMHPLLFCVVFILIAINMLFGVNKDTKSLNPFFEVGLLWGASALFYFNSLFIFPIVYLAIISFRSFYWREWVMPIMGLATVAFLTFGYFFITNGLTSLLEVIGSNVSTKAGYGKAGLFNLIFWGFTAIIFFISILSTFTGIAKKINTKQFFGFFLLLIFTITISYFSVSGISVEIYFLAAIPISYYLTNYLLNIQSSALAELVFLAFLTLFVLSKVL